MKIGILISIFLVFISCKNATKKGPDEVQSVVDSTELNTEIVENPTENSNLITFLKNPIDLQEFKIKKNRFVTTSVTNGKDYHFNPKLSDSLFYNYYYHFENVSNLISSQITVFKYGQNKHTYDDKSEYLIELNIRAHDLDLGKANLVGLTKTELESEFGTDYLTLKNRIIYSHKNSILIVELDNSIVKSYRFIKLNTKNISYGLVQQIVE